MYKSDIVLFEIADFSESATRIIEGKGEVEYENGCWGIEPFNNSQRRFIPFLGGERNENYRHMLG